MSGDNPLIGLGDFGPAAKRLIEKLSDGIGGICRPGQIRRVARAEADAAVIHAEADIEIKEMQQRAMKRMVIEQARDQANIEEVVRLALPHLKDDATPEKMDNDWIASFFDQCRIVSNEEMQTLWGRILASEANEAGSFSKRTLRLVSDLDKQDAEMFTALCRFIWGFKPSVLQPLILKVGASIYGDNGVTFGSLTHLDDIGLITFDGLGGFTRKRFSGEVDASYWGQKFRFHFAEASGNEINIGNVLMTQPGIQLARICGAQGIQGVPDYVFEYYQSHAPKMGIACVLPQPDTA